jgi:hypothetical protein
MSRVQPKVKLLRYSDPDRLSLAKASAIFLGKPDEDNIKRPLNLLRQKHKSIFRGEHVRFEFWTSKIVYDHLITYTTANVRACAGLRANQATDFVVPLEVVGTELESVIESKGIEHLNDYNALVEGVDPETKDPIKKARLQAARAIAPTSVQLHYIFEFNFLTLMESIFPQRIWEPGAQPDTKEVVRMMWELVREQDPELWDTARDVFGEEAIAWDKLRHTLKKKGITLEEIRTVLEKYDDPHGNELNVVSILLQEYGKQKSMWD